MAAMHASSFTRDSSPVTSRRGGRLRHFILRTAESIAVASLAVSISCSDSTKHGDAGEAERDAGSPPAQKDAGADVSAEAFAECAAQVPSFAPKPCAKCICSMGDKCHDLLVESTCDDDCWRFITCVYASCPTFVFALGVQELACVNTFCREHIDRATDAAQLGQCLTPCKEACTPPEPN